MEVARPNAAQLVRQAEKVLSLRKIADNEPSNEKARAAADLAEAEFWKQCGGRREDKVLTAIFVAGGLTEAQAERWSCILVHDEEADDDDELFAIVCPNCNSETFASSCNQTAFVLRESEGQSHERIAEAVASAIQHRVE